MRGLAAAGRVCNRIFRDSSGPWEGVLEMIRNGVWARRILFVLFLIHGVTLAWAVTSGIAPDTGIPTILLALLNAAALAGIATRTRFGWFLALCFIAACVGRNALTLGVDDFGGLLTVLAMAAAVLCLTDPAFRREPDIAV